MSRRALVLSLMCVLAAAAACGGDVEPEAGSGASPAGSLGLLGVERMADQDVAVEGARSTLSAAFVRYRGLDPDAVVRLIGARPPGELDTCAPLDTDEGDALDTADAEVELLDVGTIEVRLEDAVATLEPRNFPALGSVLGGVIYAGDAELGAPRPGLDAYVWTAPSADLEVSLAAPAGPGDITVDGLDATRVPSMLRGRDVEVIWDAAGAADHLEIELAAGGRVLGCLARDDGSFTLDGGMLALLGADRDGRLSIRRVRVAPVEVRDMDAAYLRAAATRTFRVAIR